MRICSQMDFVVPVDHRVKIGESEKINEYFDLDSELIKPWNMQMMVIPTVVGALQVWKGDWNS